MIIFHFSLFGLTSAKLFSVTCYRENFNGNTHQFLRGKFPYLEVWDNCTCTYSDGVRINLEAKCLLRARTRRVSTNKFCYYSVMQRG